MKPKIVGGYDQPIAILPKNEEKIGHPGKVKINPELKKQAIDIKKNGTK